ncbi:UNVERIFIED_CONTAM: hypothetical protein HDU68_007114 [Siphonaria sp. JEL0065]|nr:hypothetical protein HDU68_007114 [Siphonaria sp. JEL0065]
MFTPIVIQPINRAHWASVPSLGHLIQKLNGSNVTKSQFPSLAKAVALDPFFFETRLPCIVDWAATVPASLARRPDGCAVVGDDVAQAHIENSNLEVSQDMAALYSSTNQVAVERIRCLLSYFASYVDSASSSTRKITLERRRFDKPHTESWQSVSTLPLTPPRVSLLASSMESSFATRFVDFANKLIHIHKIIASATQEEVLFSTCPEAFLGIGLCPELADNEVILIQNVKRFAKYTGYGKSFEFDGAVENAIVSNDAVLDILVMDAVYMSHFAAQVAPPVVTGHWGCGMFGGNKTHKFIQQWLAASVSKVERFDYALFGDTGLTEFWTNIMAVVAEKKWTVGKTYSVLLMKGTIADWKRDGSYEAYVARVLGIKVPLQF